MSYDSELVLHVIFEKSNTSIVPAGYVYAATDFYCKLNCQTGPSAANGAPNLPNSGIFAPPYSINNNNTQVNISVKVSILKR
jgi:hypothetical protein